MKKCWNHHGFFGALLEWKKEICQKKKTHSTEQNWSGGEIRFSSRFSHILFDHHTSSSDQARPVKSVCMGSAGTSLALPKISLCKTVVFRFSPLLSRHVGRATHIFQAFFNSKLPTPSPPSPKCVRKRKKEKKESSAEIIPRMEFEFETITIRSNWQQGFTAAAAVFIHLCHPSSVRRLSVLCSSLLCVCAKTKRSGERVVHKSHGRDSSILFLPFSSNFIYLLCVFFSPRARHRAQRVRHVFKGNFAAPQKRFKEKKKSRVDLSMISKRHRKIKIMLCFFYTRFYFLLVARRPPLNSAGKHVAWVNI